MRVQLIHIVSAAGVVSNLAAHDPTEDLEAALYSEELESDSAFLSEGEHEVEHFQDAEGSDDAYDAFDSEQGKASAMHSTSDEDNDAYDAEDSHESHGAIKEDAVDSAGMDALEAVGDEVDELEAHTAPSDAERQLMETLASYKSGNTTPKVASPLKKVASPVKSVASPLKKGKPATAKAAAPCKLGMSDMSVKKLSNALKFIKGKAAKAKQGFGKHAAAAKAAEGQVEQIKMALKQAVDSAAAEKAKASASLKEKARLARERTVIEASEAAAHKKAVNDAKTKHKKVMDKLHGAVEDHAAAEAVSASAEASGKEMATVKSHIETAGDAKSDLDEARAHVKKAQSMMNLTEALAFSARADVATAKTRPEKIMAQKILDDAQKLSNQAQKMAKEAAMSVRAQTIDYKKFVALGKAHFDKKKTKAKAAADNADKHKTKVEKARKKAVAASQAAKCSKEKAAFDAMISSADAGEAKIKATALRVKNASITHTVNGKNSATALAKAKAAHSKLKLESEAAIAKQQQALELQVASLTMQEKKFAELTQGDKKMDKKEKALLLKAKKDQLRAIHLAKRAQATQLKAIKHAATPEQKMAAYKISKDAAKVTRQATKALVAAEK